MASFSILIVLTGALVVLSFCPACNTVTPATANESVAREGNLGSFETYRGQITITGWRAMFWWWEESVAAGMDGNNPPPKTRYLDLQRWEYDGEGITTYPHELDLIAEMKNESSQLFDGTIRFSLSARFIDYSLLTYIEGVPQCPGNLEWRNTRIILDKPIRLAPKDAMPVMTKNYSIGNLLNEKHDNNSICDFRVVVEVLSSQGKVIAASEKVIPVRLGD